MPLPQVPSPTDLIGVPVNPNEQATRLAELCVQVLQEHFRGVPISIATGLCDKSAIQAVRKHFESAGWKVKRIREEGESVLRFSRSE